MQLLVQIAYVTAPPFSAMLACYYLLDAVGGTTAAMEESRPLAGTKRAAAKSSQGREAWPPAWRGDKFILLMNRFKLLAQRQGMPIPVALKDIFDRIPQQTGLDADAYTKLVSDTFTWPEVDVIEEALIAILPEGDLVEQLRSTRLLYSRTVNESEYREYATTMSDLGGAAPTNVPDSVRVRAELLAVTQRIKYVLEQEPPKEHARALLTTYNSALIITAGVVMLLLFVVRSYMPSGHLPLEPLQLVLFVGLLGGFVSVQQRLQTPTDVDPLLKWLDLKSSGTSLLLSPIIGSVFAAIFFAILMAGLVSSPALPSFVCSTIHSDPHCAPPYDLNEFAYAASPAGGADWAKLVVWAFAAGFLERLVPDILTRIAATADPKK